eukprot:12063911-Alexandrium_andersonii.AAC.1
MLSQPHPYACPLNLSPGQWQARLEAEGVGAFEVHRQSLERALERRDTSEYWHHWSSAVQETFENVARHNGSEQSRGPRGTPTFY